MRNVIEFKNDLTVYLIVKEFPPIILSGEPEEPIEEPIKDFIPEWKPKQIRISVDPETGQIYDRDEDVEIDKDCTMFLYYQEAVKFCNKLNKKGVV